MARRTGYTLIETIVAVLLFAVGGLALVTTSQLLGRSLTANGIRDAAARIAASRLEILGAECRRAVGGSESVGRVESRWSVSFPDSMHVAVHEAVGYPTSSGWRTDFYRAVLPCAR